LSKTSQLGIPQLRVVQLTPPGRGAVATLLVEGPGAVEVVDSRLRTGDGRPLKSRPIGQLVLGRFGVGMGGGPTEHIIVRRRGDRAVELHCHGGDAAVAMVENGLVELGCRVVSWRDWAVEHYRDPTVAAARAALAEACTQRTASILLDQYQGALRRALKQIDQFLRINDTAGASELIKTLSARSELGLHLVRPWRVVLSGATNVGKSSLVNALVGYARTIVHHTPGTTRDVVNVSTAVDGWPVELCDTAGLGDEAMQRAGIRKAERRLAEADLVVVVFDVTRPWSESDRRLIEAYPEALVVGNKSDLVAWSSTTTPVCAEGSYEEPDRRARLGVCFGKNWITTSALTGAGIDAVVRAIADRLVPDPPPPGAAVPFTAAQIEYLASCRSRAGSGTRFA